MEIINQDLKKTQFTLNAVLDAIAQDFIIVDEAGKVSYMNLKARSNLFAGETGTNTSILELIQKITQTFDFENGKELIELCEKTNKAESFVTERLKIKITKSIKKSYEVYTAPIYDPGLGHLGRFWQFTDISIQEDIDRLKTEFISIASHQLRTPLTSIRGYISMILDGDYGEVNPENKEPLGYVEKAGKEMEDLIDDLLNISRLEKRTTESSMTSFTIDEVITELKTLFQKRIDEKHIVFSYEPYVQGLSITTDQNKFRECLKNLIDNAIKYNRDGGAVSIRTVPIDQNTFTINVGDNGIGIPEDQQDRIFEKFFRAANVLTENFDGTGIGLYYVKEAITDLGGEVSFTSKVGIGTTFTIKFPINQKGD